MRTIAHVSDLHFGRECGDIADALRGELHGLAPSLLVISGDLTQRARRRQFFAARRYLESLPGPQLVVPGNHDVPLFDVIRRFVAPLARYRALIHRDVDPWFEDEELLVVGINTARSLTWKSGRISVEQIASLEARLRASRAQFKAVVTHHPFIPPPDASDPSKIDLVGRADRALTVLDSGRVDLLLAGHLHHGYSGDTRTYYPAFHRGIVSAQAGTAMSNRLRPADANGYNLITLEHDRMEIEVRTWRGRAFESRDTVAYSRGDKGWDREKDSG